MAKKRQTRPNDACPFPPGVNLPGKTRTSIISASIFADPRFLTSALVVAGIIFILGFTLVPPPVIKLPGEPNIWSSTTPIGEGTDSVERPEQWIPKYQNVTTIKDDIILSGDETYTIENGSYYLLGSIFVQDNAKLIIRNADISIRYKSGYSQEDPIQTAYNGLIIGNARLEVLNSTIYYPKPGEAIIGLYENSSCKIVDSDLPLLNINQMRNSDLELDGSRVRYIVLGENANTRLNSSDVYDIWPVQFDFGDVYDDREPKLGELKLDAQDSRITWLTTFNRNSTVNVSESLSGYRDSWSSGEIASSGTGLDINLTRCNVSHYQIWAEGGNVTVTNVDDLYGVLVRWSNLKISNCSLVHLSVGGEGTIYNCLVQVLNIFQGEFQVSDCKVNDLYLNSLHGVLTLNRVMTNKLTGHDFNCTITGGFVIENTTSPWLQGHSQVTRSYPIQVLNGERAAPNIELEIFNSTGQTLWKGSTDNLGSAMASITYYQNLRINDLPEKPGLKDTLRLVTMNGLESRETEIGLMSDTPVVVTFPEAEAPFWSQGWFIQGLSIIVAVSVIVLFLVKRKPS